MRHDVVLGEIVAIGGQLKTVRTALEIEKKNSRKSLNETNKNDETVT